MKPLFEHVLNQEYDQEIHRLDARSFPPIVRSRNRKLEVIQDSCFQKTALLYFVTSKNCTWQIEDIDNKNFFKNIGNRVILHIPPFVISWLTKGVTPYTTINENDIYATLFFYEKWIRCPNRCKISSSNTSLRSWKEKYFWSHGLALLKRWRWTLTSQ